MSEGQHTARVEIKADSRGADKELATMARTNRKLNEEVNRLSDALGKAQRAEYGLQKSTESLAATQKKAAAAAKAQAQATANAQAALAQRGVDTSRRERQAVEANIKSSLAQRLAAIKKEENARLYQNSIELRAAKSEADMIRVKDRQLAIAHDAQMSRLRAQTEAVDRLMRAEKARPTAAGDGGGLGRIASVAGTAGRVAGAAGLGAVAMGAAAVAASELAQESLQVQNIFKNLPYSLNSARDATRGLADDMTLAKNAIMANQSGVATTAEQYTELTGMAQTLALKMGRDVSDTVERVTMGIAKQEREILDELVILPRMEDMWQQYAKSLGKATKDLTDHEKNTAFTTSALEAMRKATKGVSVDMDGAAAAIARTTVQAKNLKTQLLGGVQAEVSFADGVKGLDQQILRSVTSMGTYRNDFYKVIQALQDAGVNTDKYRDNAKLLEEDIIKLTRSEGARLVRMGENKKLTTDQIADVEKLLGVTGLLSNADTKLLQRELERLNAAKKAEGAVQAAAAAQLGANKARLLEVEESLAFGRAAKIAQEQINALVAEEAELKALVLEADGKSAEAAETRREAQLAALEAAGESTISKKKKGGKSPKDIAREIADAEADARISAARRTLQEVERAHAKEKASYAQLEAAVRAVQAAEKEGAEVTLRDAKGKADKIRAEIELRDLELSQRYELLDLATAEQELAKQRNIAALQKLKTDREALAVQRASAMTSLERGQALRGSGPRVAAPGRQTLAQGLGIDAVGVQSQASADLARDVAANEERRALRQSQLDEERAFQQELVALSRGSYDAKEELAGIAAETDQLNHERSMDLLRQRELAEQEALQREIERQQVRRQTIQAAADFGLSQAERGVKTAISIAKTERDARRQAMAAAKAEGKSTAEIEKAGADAAKRSRGESLIALGEELQGEAISYGFKAIAAGIALNPVGAATNAGAAVVMGGAAAAVKAKGRGLIASAGGGGGDGASDSGGSIPSAGGGGGGAPTPGTQSSVPPSPLPNSQGNTSGGQSSQSSAASSGPVHRTVTVQINAPLVDERTVREIRDIMDRHVSDG